MGLVGGLHLSTVYNFYPNKNISPKWAQDQANYDGVITSDDHTDDRHSPGHSCSFS